MLLFTLEAPVAQLDRVPGYEPGGLFSGLSKIISYSNKIKDLGLTTQVLFLLLYYKVQCVLQLHNLIDMNPFELYKFRKTQQPIGEPIQQAKLKRLVISQPTKGPFDSIASHTSVATNQEKFRKIARASI